jgi:hypothetical protein
VDLWRGLLDVPRTTEYSCESYSRPHSEMATIGWSQQRPLPRHGSPSLYCKTILRRPFGIWNRIAPSIARWRVPDAIDALPPLFGSLDFVVCLHCRGRRPKRNNNTDQIESPLVSPQSAVSHLPRVVTLLPGASRESPCRGIFDVPRALGMLEILRKRRRPLVDIVSLD